MFAKITEQDRGCYLTTEAMRHCGELVYTVVKLTPEQYKKACEMLGEIEWGLPVTELTPSAGEKRGIHGLSSNAFFSDKSSGMGIVGETRRTIISHGTSSYELKFMVQDYEEDQKIRKELIQKGFQEMKVIKVDPEDENEDNENFIKMLNQYSLKDYIHETALLVDESRYFVSLQVDQRRIELDCWMEMGRMATGDCVER